MADDNLTPKQGFFNPEHGFRMVGRRNETRKNREESEKKRNTRPYVFILATLEMHELRGPVFKN